MEKEKGKVWYNWPQGYHSESKYGRMYPWYTILWNLIWLIPITIFSCLGYHSESKYGRMYPWYTILWNLIWLIPITIFSCLTYLCFLAQSFSHKEAVRNTYP